MKHDRLLAFLLILTVLFSLTSCKEKDYHGNSHDNSNIHNPQQGNNSQHEEQEGGEGKVTYVYSVVSKTLHLPGCYHIGRINEEYRFEYTGSISELLKKGYTICRDCLVPDDEKEEEPDEEEDDTNKVAKEDATFVINKSSKALHTLDCFRIDTMDKKNIQYTDLTLEDIIALDEYKPCRDCLPDEAEEWKELHGKE
jgi:hypothetical protein